MTGDHCHQFGKKSEDILDAIEELMGIFAADKITGTDKMSVALREALNDRIGTLISHVKVLSYVFNRICHDMYDTDKKEDDFIEAFDQLCELFRILWKRCGLSETPKVHILVSHVPGIMRKFRRTGILAEYIIERSWIADHNSERMYSCILNWQNRQELKNKREAVGQLQETMKIDCASKKNQRERHTKRESLPAEAPKTLLEILELIRQMQTSSSLFDIFSPEGAESLFDEIDWFDNLIEEVEEGIKFADNH